MTRAIGLLSGGLDSILAVRVIQNQGIEVLPVSFVTPFFDASQARRAADELGLELRVLDITEPHLAMVKNPPHGYGKNMNPCIDCHALMLNQAGKVMEKEGYAFLFTGEVMGERPMSQNKQSLWVVARDSGYPDRVLRPLSARFLEPTCPEREGLVDRERLLDISGRGRKRQIKLAKEYGLKSYPPPAGGCLLTDPAFSRRLRDLLDHDPEAEPREMQLLRIGRHLRLPPRPDKGASRSVKIIVGRTETDNNAIEGIRVPGQPLLQLVDYPGPTVLIPGEPSEEDLTLAARICARYGDAPKGKPCKVGVSEPFERVLEVVPAESGETAELMI